MDADVRELVIRFYDGRWMQMVIAGGMGDLLNQRFPNIQRIVLEMMSEVERSEAATIDQGIIQIHQTCFVFARVGHELHRIDIKILFYAGVAECC